MLAFTENRKAETADELWIVEHPPVYTFGLNGKPEHLLEPGPIPVIRSDRGGQITYHGPGQLIVYALIDLARHQLGVRALITILERAMIETLAQYGIAAYARPEAPGVYVEGKKIGSVGLRIKKNRSYHGLSLNNRMDLSPFKGINPCGYPGLEVTQLAEHDVYIQNHELAVPIVHHIFRQLS
ncbi:MAG: lipoyl(octanoyl) transferase LipB [Gammaproteobacteria bacterium]